MHVWHPVDRRCVMCAVCCVLPGCHGGGRGDSVVAYDCDESALRHFMLQRMDWIEALCGVLMLQLSDDMMLPALSAVSASVADLLCWLFHGTVRAHSHALFLLFCYLKHASFAPIYLFTKTLQAGDEVKNELYSNNTCRCAICVQLKC